MRNVRRTYILLIIIILYSGTPCFSLNTDIATILFIYLTYNVIREKIKISFKSITILSLFLLVIVLRGLYRDSFTVYDFSQLIIFIDIFLVAHLVKNDFAHCYVNIMKWSAIISLSLWGGIQISNSFYNILLSLAKNLPQLANTAEYMQNSSNPAYSLYVFTVSLRPEAILRNSGLFYEPGLYAVYITLASVIYLMNNNFQLLSKIAILFLLTILSTFSTSGYLAFVLIIVSWIIFSENVHVFFKIFMGVFIPSFVIYIYSLDFVGEKISTNIEMDGNTQSRFYAVIYHWEMIKKTSYILGCYLKNTEISPNGLSMVLMRWGIPLSIIYYILLFRGLFFLFNENGKLKKIIYLLPIFATVFSQVATIYPLFYSIIFVGCIKCKSTLPDWYT